MSICIETGEGLVDSNSYVGTQEAIDFAKQRGLDFPCSVQDVRHLSFKAMDRIESYSDRFKGHRTSQTQALSWPRCGVYIGDKKVAEDEIPIEVKNLQIQMMISIHSGFDPMSNVSSEPFIIDEMVGPLRVKYSEESYRGRNSVPVIDRLLDLLTTKRGKIEFVRA